MHRTRARNQEKPLLTSDFIKAKSLQQLEQRVWDEPSFDSYLVKTCHRLWQKPLADFTTEDLRMMIGQAIGLRWLVPLALEKLAADPFIEGDFFPGDLLFAVLRVEDTFWANHPDMVTEVKAITQGAKAALVDVNHIPPDTLDPLLVELSRRLLE